MRHPQKPPTALAERIPLPCSTPYDLARPVRALRKELGLTPNDLAVLTALISFLPRDNRDTAQIGLTVVFASNASLSDRANGIDERTLRRCLGRLTAAGLIERKGSANGKRFPLRYGGAIRDAFGIDLKPLILSHQALVARAARLAEEHERLRSLRAEALALGAAMIVGGPADEARLSALAMARTILRRATLTAETILQVIASLRALGADGQPHFGERDAVSACSDDPRSSAEDGHAPRSPTDTVTGRNGLNVRHTESRKKENKMRCAKLPGYSLPGKGAEPAPNRGPDRLAWSDFPNIAGFFPDAPQSADNLTRVLFDIGRLLRIRQDNLTRGLLKAGAGRMLSILDYLLGRADTIRQPDAYLARVIAS